MTINRGWLRRQAEQGKLTLVGSYYFDDMYGVSDREPVSMPVEMQPADWHDRKEGICYMMPIDFKTKSGCAWKNPNGTVTLIVHSNCNYTFKIKEG